MARDEAPPFDRGEYEATAGALDHLIGKEWVFEDVDYSQRGTKPARTNRPVTCRLVRNDSGGALLPKRLGVFSTVAGEYGAVIDGMTSVSYGEGYPIDEFLPSAGVPDGAYFWIVVKGPAVVLTPIAGSEFNGDISIGQRLVALTAATSGATTAGRVAAENITASTQTADYSQILDEAANRIGRALSAKTTGNTNSDILVEIDRW